MRDIQLKKYLDSQKTSDIANLNPNLSVKKFDIGDSQSEKLDAKMPLKQNT